MSFSPFSSPSPFSLWARPNAGDILLCSASCETEEFQVFSQSGSSLGPAYHTVPVTTETSSPALQTANDPQTASALPYRFVVSAPSSLHTAPLATAATTPSTTTTTTSSSSVAVRPRDDNDADDADADQSPSKRAKPIPRPTPTTTKPPRRPRRTMAPAPTPRRRRARAQQTTTPPSSSGSGSGSRSSPPTQTFTFADPATPFNMYESLAASGLRTDKYRPLETGGRKGFRGREAVLHG
ncbi:MAG: hypothetical protein L6R36_006908 [Xanthoria steineri]|nr:MAG: hypothetical protein L6R36_006908 [Xanthoria steineri]